MFQDLIEQPADKILALVQAYKEDSRDQKIDLGVGVYKNAEGITPVMRAVKTAEHQLWQQETTKSYVCLLYTSPSPRDRTRSRMPSSA